MAIAKESPTILSSAQVKIAAPAIQLGSDSSKPTVGSLRKYL